MYFETEMYHAAAKSFVRVWLSVMRERTVLPYDCACTDEFTGAVRCHQTKELRDTVIPKRPLGKIYRAGRDDLTPPCNIADTIRVCYEINAKKSRRENLCGIYYAISASVLRDLTPRERTDPAGASGERNAW